MPQYNSYPLNTSFLAADIFLFYDTANTACKTITGTNLVASVKTLIDRSLVTNVVSGNTTLDLTYQFVVGNSGGGFTITLPLGTSDSRYTGYAYRIFNKGAGTVTVAKTGADTINGAASFTLAQYAGATLTYDGLGMWSKI